MEKFKTYTQNQANEIFAHSIKLDINTMMLVEVVKVDYANQTVDVQPVIKAVVRDSSSNKIIRTVIGEDIKVKDVQMPVIQKVPLSYARAGTAMITMPIQVGDTGMLIISQRDISIWKQQGGIAEQSKGAQMFDINDGVFLPFVANQTNKDTNYSENKLQIKFGNDIIEMGGDGKVKMNCSLDVTGTVTATTDCVGGGVSLKGHTHNFVEDNVIVPPTAKPTTAPN